MSKYKVQERKRNQTLLIVEGNHEKNELFWLIFKCFPEVDIDLNNVWIYGTNIYMLYEDIVNMYGHDWVEEEIDVYVEKIRENKQQYQNDFYFGAYRIRNNEVELIKNSIKEIYRFCVKNK